MLSTLRFPQRTCVGCRSADDKVALLRVVRCDGDLCVDPKAVLPGRGAYLHPRVECLKRAERSRALVRSLGMPPHTPLTAVREYLESAGPPVEPRGSTG